MNAEERRRDHPMEQSPLLLPQQISVNQNGRNRFYVDHDGYPDPSSLNEHQRDDLADKNHDAVEHGTADVTQTIMNLAKTCAGTGCLALPYACQQGGAVSFVAGLVAAALWNVYGVERLVRCQGLLHIQQQQPYNHQMNANFRNNDTVAGKETSIRNTLQRHNDNDDNKNNNFLPPPPATASTMGKVAWVACGGPRGLLFMDLMLMILFFGIVIAYVSAVISFLSDTPLSCGSVLDALVVATLMALLSMVPNLAYLSNASAVGLVVLAGTFAVITAYGVWGMTDHDQVTTTMNTNDTQDDYSSNNNNHVHLNNDNDNQEDNKNYGIPFTPASIRSLARSFGVVVFGYGVVPLTFNFQESMREPHRLVEATFISMSLVAGGYCTIGIGLLFLFGTVEGEILHELPNSGVIPTLTRLAMASVCIMTAPLIIVPTGELLEQKFHLTKSHHRCLVRGMVCLVSATVAVALPTFVQVLSFVGCFCVGLTGFCVPPLLHLQLLRHRANQDHKQDMVGVSISQASQQVSVDIIMLIVGFLATVIGTCFSV